MIDSTLLAESSWVERIVLKEPVNIRRLGDTVDKCWESVVMPLYNPDESGTKLAKITREFHVVNDLDCKLLIGKHITVPEQVVISLAKGNFLALRVTPRRGFQATC